MSKEKLWSFWQSTVTAVIKRALGPSRLKVVPPVRLPSQLGEGKLRPKTSKARPLTARRTKVLGGDKSNPQLGLTASFHFIKVCNLITTTLSTSYLPSVHICTQVEEAICSTFRNFFLKQGVKDMEEEGILQFMCLAGFVLLLGRCCRGWTPKHSPNKSHPQTTLFDVGSFLIGVEVSMRQLVPEKTKGLIGPLTNGMHV